MSQSRFGVLLRIPAVASLIACLVLATGCWRLEEASDDHTPPDNASENIDVTTVDMPSIAIAEDGKAFVAYRERLSRLGSHAEILRARAFRYDTATGATDAPRTEELRGLASDLLALDADDSGRAVLLQSVPGAADTVRTCNSRGAEWTCVDVTSTADNADIALDGSARAVALLQNGSDLQETSIDATGASRMLRGLPLPAAPEPPVTPGQHVKFHSLGAGFAAFALLDGRAFAAQYDRATDTWSAATQIGDLGGTTKVRDVRLALARDTVSAAPFAIFLHTIGNDPFRLHSQRYVPGTGWDAISAIPDSEGADNHAASMSRDGATFVLWHDTANNVRAQRHDGGWDAAATTLGRTLSERLAIATDDDGNAVAVWANGEDLMLARYLRGSGWSPATRVAQTTPAHAFAVAIDRNRVVLAFASAATNGSSRLTMRTLPLDFALLSSAPAVFGGDRLALRLLLAAPASSTTTYTLEVDDAGTAPLALPATVEVAAGQQSIDIVVPTQVVNAFVPVVMSVTAVDGSRTAHAVTVMPEPVVSIEASATIALGLRGALTVGVQAPYPVPLRVALTADNAHLSLPPFIDIPTNATHIASSLVTGESLGTSTVTARLRNSTASTTIEVTGTGGAGEQRTLTIYVQGVGTVTDTGTPPRLSCSGVDACSANFDRGARVQLAAAAAAGQRFARWAGDADCEDGVVTLASDVTCVANFVSTAASWAASGTAQNRNPLDVASFIDTPVLRVAPSGDATLAWRENDRVYVRRPSGAVDTVDSSATLDQGPALAIDDAGNAVVAYANGLEFERDIRVRRYDGSAWVNVGPAPDSSDSADTSGASVVVLRGEIVVAFAERTPGANNRIRVRRWDGSAWQPVGIGGGPAPGGPTVDSTQPRLVVTGGTNDPALALLWTEDGQRLRVAELIGDTWVTTPTAPFAGTVQADRADITWTAALGLVVAAAPDTGQRARIDVRHWQGSAWSDVGTPRGDTDSRAFLLALAFSHGAQDSTPLLAYAVNRSGGAVQETRVERFEGGAWTALGAALPVRTRQGDNGSPRAVAVADHAQPFAAVVLQGNLPGTATGDSSLVLFRFE